MVKKPFITPSAMKVIVPSVLIIIAAVIVTIVYWGPISTFFGNPDAIKHYVEAAGPWGPIVFVAAQFLQILVAPIPGQAVGVIAGALFGPWLGLLYSMVGAILGFTTVFVLAKLLGRPFVERFVKKKDLDKFDAITKKAGALVLFLIFLLPGFPDDVICYLAGLSNLRIRTLVLVSIAGRLPGYLITSFMGAGIGSANTTVVAVLVSVVGLAAVISYVFRRDIQRLVHNLLNDDDQPPAPTPEI